jgi:hypothetical protein
MSKKLLLIVCVFVVFCSSYGCSGSAPSATPAVEKSISTEQAVEPTSNAEAVNPTKVARNCSG